MRAGGPQLQDRQLPLGEHRCEVGAAAGSTGSCWHSRGIFLHRRQAGLNANFVQLASSVCITPYSSAPLPPHRPPPARPLLQIWPIKVLKVAVSFFFEVFYISSLGIFCVSLDCTYYRPGPKTNEVRRGGWGA